MNSKKSFSFVNALLSRFIIGLSAFFVIGCTPPRYMLERSEEERSLHYAVDVIGEVIGNSYNMRCISAKVASDKRSEIYGLSFYSKEKITLDQARLIGPAVYNFFSHALKNFVNLDNFVAVMSQRVPDISWAPSETTITLKITYWNEEMEYQSSPYLAAITYTGETFAYYEADPKTQKLCLLFSESNKDAINHLATKVETLASQDVA
jgi:hypothetical protein